MKRNIIIATASAVVLAVAVALFFFFNEQSYESKPELSTANIQSILLVNNKEQTTKSLSKGNINISPIMNFFNDTKEVDEQGTNHIGEASIYYEDESLTLTIYENGFMLGLKFYSSEGFDYESFYEDLDEEATPFTR